MTDRDGPARSRSRRAFLAAVAVGTGATAGCGAGYGGSDATTASAPVHWRLDAASDAVDDGGDRLRRVLYEAGGLSRDVELRLDPGPMTTDLVPPRLLRHLEAGEPDPDLLLLRSGWLQSWPFPAHLAGLDALVPSVADRVTDAFAPAAVAQGRDPTTGTLYGLPLVVNAPAVLYRRDWVEAAGYDPASADWATSPLSWRAFSHAAADAAAAADGEAAGFATQWDTYVGTACCTFNEVLSSWGGAYFGDQPLGPAGDRPVTVDGRPARRALGMVRRFVAGTEAEGFEDYAADLLPRDALDWMEETSLAPFLAGDVAFHRNWPYALRRASAPAADGGLGADLGAMPLPAGVPTSAAEYRGAGGSTAALGAGTVVANARTDRRDDVAAVLRALARPETQRALQRELGWLSPRPSLVGEAPGALAPFADTLRYAVEHAVPRPSGSVWDEEASAIASRVNAVAAGAASVDGGVTALAGDLRSLEAEAGEG